MEVRLSLWLAVDAHNLLPRRVGRTREDPSLGHRRVTLVLQNSAHRNVLVAEGLEQQAAQLIVANDTYRKHVDPQIREIMNRIGTASRHHAAFAMFQDEDWRFARYAGNLPENKFVGHQVAEHGHGDFGK